MARDSSIVCAVASILLFLLGHLISSSPVTALVLVWGVSGVLMATALVLHACASIGESLTRKRGPP